MTDQAYEDGIAVREAMFGPAGGRAKVEGSSDFVRELEERVTRHCFGETWTREMLPRNVRSMLTLSMLVALGRNNQIGPHTKGALANGVTPDEIREVLLHAMQYCGIPAAVDAFRFAGEAIAEVEAT